MGFRVNTNIAAMNAHMHLVMNTVKLDKSMESLSSGLRINRAADDSAGLSIANKLSAQSQGLGQAIKNANDGIGMVQTADGALEEYTNILKRIRTLAVQADNDTQDLDSRGYISNEIKRLVSELDHIASETKFNGKTLINSAQTFKFHVGAYRGESTSTAMKDMTTATVLGAFTVTSQSLADATISNMDSAKLLTVFVQL